MQKPVTTVPDALAVERHLPNISLSLIALLTDLSRLRIVSARAVIVPDRTIWPDLAYPSTSSWTNAEEYVLKDTGRSSRTRPRRLDSAAESESVRAGCESRPAAYRRGRAQLLRSSGSAHAVVES